MRPCGPLGGRVDLKFSNGAIAAAPAFADFFSCLNEFCPKSANKPKNLRAQTLAAQGFFQSVDAKTRGKFTPWMHSRAAA